MTEPTQPDEERSLAGLAKHSLVYSAAPFLRQVISVAMTRFYTSPSWLGKSGFGVKENVDLWMIGLQQLLGQNVLGAMVRFYFDHKDEEKRARVVTSSTVTITLLAWAVCGVALLFSGGLSPLLLGRGEVVDATELELILRLTLLLIPFQLSSLSGFYYLQILKRSSLYSTLQTGKLLFEVAMNFWLIGALGLGVRGFLISMLAGEALTTLGLTGWMLVTLRPRVDFAILRPILRYAAPLIPVGLCQFALHGIDRRLLIAFTEESGQDAAGVYGLGYKIGYLVNAMMLGSFLQIWQPWIFGVRDERERAALVARVSTYAVLAIAAATVGVIVFGRQAVDVLSGDPGFRIAWTVVPLIAAGYVCWALYQVSQIPLFLAKRTARLFGINAIALVANVALNAWLIPEHGILGAGIATCATFALLALLGVLASRSVARVPFEVGRLVATLTVVAAGAAGTYGIEHVLVDGLEWSLPAVLGLKAAFLVVLLAAFGVVLSGRERARFLRWARERAGRG